MSARIRDWVVARWEGGDAGVARGLDLLLWPAERLFSTGVLARNRAYDLGLFAQKRAAIPVVSVGNLTVGGVGKTPLAAWIARRFLGWEYAPAVVLRGYGADEILVHRELNPAIPVYAAARRAEGIARAVEDGRTVAVLDDGFQHRAMARDLDIVVVSADGWTGRQRLLPRGPWREGLGALRRAGLVVVTRKSVSMQRSREVVDELRAFLPGGAIATCRMAQTGFSALHPDAAPTRSPAWIAGQAVLAVASLGDPTAFRKQLENLGAQVELMAFPDHHDFNAADVQRITTRAATRTIVVTRKEAVKLRALLPAGAPVLVAEQEVEFESGEAEVVERLRGAVSR